MLSTEVVNLGWRLSIHYKIFGRNIIMANDYEMNLNDEV
jgi:hypothetical protein